MRVLLAPDAFKGSCSAAEAAHALAAGLQARSPDLEIVERPVADGGEGTVAAVVTAGARLRTVSVSGPLGEPVAAAYAVLPGAAGRPTTAVVELAQAAGLTQVPQPPDGTSARTATTRGVGEVVAAALDEGARRIVLAVGGSATTDGGAGMLQALGLRLTDEDGTQVGPGGAALATVTAADVSGLDARLRDVEVVVACDVDNPLLGEHGAAAVYGPQKGAGPADVRALDAALAVFAETLCAATGRDVAEVPGTGAAGGTAYGAVAALGADLTPGIELVLELVGFADALEGADLVVTGEGRLDAQTLRGKAPAGVAAAARRAGVPVVAVAGQVDLTPEEADRAGLRATYSLLDLAPDVQTAMREAPRLLTAVGERLATDLLSPDPSSQTPHTKDVTA